jgi:predicted ATPase
MIRKIYFTNYKSFKESQELELKPITILIGKNNSGKSAIAKLPALVSWSLSGDFNQPIKWKNDDGVKLGESYGDLIYNKNFVTSNLGLKIEDEEGNEKLSVTIKGDEKGKTEFIEYSFNHMPIDLKKSKFKGFISSEVEFKNLKINYDYIGSFRKLPEISYPNNFNEYDKIGIDGGNAYPILIQDYESKGSILASVRDWYQVNFEGWKLEVLPIVSSPPAFQIVLSNDGITKINLQNVGQGMNQALPLIVRSYMKAEEDVLIIIEEPETHLHPAAHGNLAERFIQSYLQDNKKHYLIETHSQNFVLRIRKLVAQGILKVEDLAIYYVDFDQNKSLSTLEKIDVDEFGRVDKWPEGVFNETLDETIGIRTAQLDNPKYGN